MHETAGGAAFLPNVHLNCYVHSFLFDSGVKIMVCSIAVMLLWSSMYRKVKDCQ